jgi:hypothetical protein
VEYLRHKLYELLGTQLPLLSGDQGVSPASHKSRARLPKQLPLPW